MPMMKAETSPGAPGACASHQHHHHQVGSPVNSSKSSRSLKFINLPSGTLALLATIGFLSLNYHCLSVEGYEHHRWRHRDRGSISHLPHHLPLAPIGIGPLSTAPASVATTAEETNRSQGENEEEESEEEEEEDLAPDYSSGSSLGFGLCSRCPPGFGVARRCTLVQDTVCHSCPPSYYAPSYSRRHACWPCSKCGEGLYEVQPCTGTSDTVCQACLHPPHLAGTDKSPINGNMHLCGHHHHHHHQQHHRGNINNGGGPSSSSSSQQQRNLLSTLTIGDSNKNKRTTSGNLIHFLNHPAGGSPAAGAITNNNNNSSSKNEPPTTLGSFPSEINAETSSAEEDEVALGVAQLAAFQVVLIFTAVAAILALTCRLRVFSSHEPARLKLTETYRDDGVALIEQLSES